MVVLVLAGIGGCAGGDRWERVDHVPPEVSRVSGSMPIFSQRFMHGLPAGWKPAFEQTAGGRYIIEYLPAGQTVHDWREMITVQGFRNMAKVPGASPRRILEVMIEQHRKICGERLVSKLLGEGRVDSYSAFTAIIGCNGIQSNHPSGLRTGQGEIAYYIAIQGTNDIYLIHRAARFETGTSAQQVVDQVTRGMGATGPIKLCELDVPQTACWERRPR